MPCHDRDEPLHHHQGDDETHDEPDRDQAIVALRYLMPVLDELKGTGGKVLRTSLSHEDEAKLQTALSAPKQRARA